MFNRMKTVVTFAAGAVAGLMLAACLTVQGSRPGVFGGGPLILPLLALLLYVGYEAGRLSTLAQAGSSGASAEPGRRTGKPNNGAIWPRRNEPRRWRAGLSRKNAECGEGGEAGRDEI